MCSFKSIYFVIFILNLYGAHGEISDKRLCADQDCNEPLSLARTLLRYSSPDPRILSFAPNTEVTIYSKEAGSETTLWGAVIKGKRGYVPKHLLREFKVFKKPTLLVDTELKQKPQVPEETVSKDIDPDKTKQPYEIVEGTTVYLNPQDGISPSSTESPVVATSLPPASNVDEQTAPVNDSKETDTAKRDNTQESIVEKVSSSFSNWMNDGTDSEETDAEDDEEDDDEDEEDDEESIEDELEQTEDKPQEQTSEEAQDVNSLHNLPPGVKVSTYSLEVDQLGNKTSDTDTDKNDKLTQESNNPEPVRPPTENKEESAETLEDVMKNEPSQTVETSEPEKLEKTETIESEKTEQLGKETENGNMPEGEVKSDAETVEESKPVKSKADEGLNKDTENTISENVTESVTETSLGIEDEQVPILDEVTTPNPLDLKKPDDLLVDEDTANTTSQDTEGNKNIEVEPTAATSDEASDNPETTVPRSVDSPPSDNSAENQNITADGGKHSVISDLFNKPQNDELEGDREAAVSEEVEKGSDSNEGQTNVNTENVGEFQKNVPSDLPDGSEVKTVRNEDQGEDNPSTNDVPGSTETDEPPANSIENEILIDGEMNSQEQNEEDQNNDIKEELQNDEDKINIEVSSQEPPATSAEEPSELSPEQPNEIPLEEPSAVIEEGPGIWSGLFSFFDGSSAESTDSVPSEQHSDVENVLEENLWGSQNPKNPISSESYCEAGSESCNTSQQEALEKEYGLFDNIDLKFNSDFFLLLVTTAGSVIVFLFVYMVLDRHKREAPLVARINKLEKELLVTLKENELLQEKGASLTQEEESVPNEVVEQLTRQLAEAQLARQALEERVPDLEIQLETKAVLEEQIESLEKELETSTEVGMELNRIISEMLDPTNGSDRLKENVEQLQRQLLEQKDTINDVSEALQETEAENRTLHGDLERTKKAAAELQSKVDEMVKRILKIEQEKDQQQNSLQNEITVYQQRYNEANCKAEVLTNEIQIVRVQLAEIQRQADVKTKEYQTLKESLNKVKSLKNNSEALKSLLDATSIKAEIQQLKTENATYAAQLQQEQVVKVGFEKKYQAVLEEMGMLKEKYELADKEKVEVNSKLEVLNNYFKKRESELQEEIIKYRSIWDAKEGEATSTTERIKYLQEEIENYKAQNETLKQEIISQEIDLKSQISVLEKKVHENWVTARQTDRKLEDTRQEAAQLRNRLTLRERAINEERIQNRLQSPVEQNGELPLSPHPIDSPASPPLLYGARDHITKSPPLPGMPPFLPLPPGAPFMPPPLHGMPPFVPPPPSMFPGDHRPPPLGRMSSPPLNSRYSPDTSAFSPYDRHSPSPPYDSEYGASPPPMRGYSPYNSRDDRRDYKRPPHGRTNGRNAKGSVMSSGSDHSNDSLNKINRKQSKMV